MEYAWPRDIVGCLECGDVDGFLQQLEVKREPINHEMDEICCTAIAAQSGNIDVVKKCLEYSADPNFRDLRSYTPLMGACWYGHVDIVKLLLANSANLDAINDKDTTSFELAYKHKHWDVVSYLLDYHAESLFFVDEQGNSCLHNAAENGDLTLLSLLLPYVPQHVIESDPKNNNNETYTCILKRKGLWQSILSMNKKRVSQPGNASWSQSG